MMLVFPKHKRSSLDICILKRVLTELASRAPMSSSYVALSCNIQSNRNTNCSSGSDVVFLRSLRMSWLVAEGVLAEFNVVPVPRPRPSPMPNAFVDAKLVLFFSHKFSKSFTFCKYSSIRQFRWYSFCARRQCVATYLMIISAMGKPVMSKYLNLVLRLRSASIKLCTMSAEYLTPLKRNNNNKNSNQSFSDYPKSKHHIRSLPSLVRWLISASLYSVTMDENMLLRNFDTINDLKGHLFIRI